MLDPVVVAVDGSAVLSGFFSVRDSFLLKVGSTEYDEGILGDVGSGRSRCLGSSGVGDKGNRAANGTGSQQEGGSDLEHGVEIENVLCGISLSVLYLLL